MTATMLEILGYRSMPAYSGAEGLRLAEQELPQVVFLDLGMPEMDGYEVARSIKGNPRLQRIKIVALSGWGDEATRAKTTAIGFDLHLTKPAQMDQLVGFIERMSKQRPVESTA